MKAGDQVCPRDDSVDVKAVRPPGITIRPHGEIGPRSRLGDILVDKPLGGQLHELLSPKIPSALTPLDLWLNQRDVPSRLVLISKGLLAAGTSEPPCPPGRRRSPPAESSWSSYLCH